MLESEDHPDVVHAPLGNYSHVVRVPPGSELVFISGQVGITRDGTTPDTIEAQADLAFANLVALVEAEDLAVTDIAKLQTFIVSGHDGNAVRDARVKHLGSHRPASTAVYVAALVSPVWFVEVEAVAVRK